eukprot:1148863-Pelagomonas_calceolata.AAC.8
MACTHGIRQVYTLTSSSHNIFCVQYESRDDVFRHSECLATSLKIGTCSDCFLSLPGTIGVGFLSAPKIFSPPDQKHAKALSVEQHTEMARTLHLLLPRQGGVSKIIALFGQPQRESSSNSSSNSSSDRPLVSSLGHTGPQKQGNRDKMDSGLSRPEVNSQPDGWNKSEMDPDMSQDQETLARLSAVIEEDVTKVGGTQSWRRQMSCTSDMEG